MNSLNHPVMAQQSGSEQPVIPYSCYGVRINVVELCARLQAYDITKPQIQAFTSTPRAKSLPLEITKTICNALFDDIYSAKRHNWQAMSACAQSKCGLWHHLSAEDRARWQEPLPVQQPNLYDDQGMWALRDYQMQLMLLERYNKMKSAAAKAHKQSLNAQLEQLRGNARSLTVCSPRFR